ncbi:MAG: hypothetical protein IJQ86_01910 [Spirochaetia bacterium]|nr:hypothetical protein [Spirochaetia bacterium]
MKKFFSLILFLLVVGGIFAEGTAEGYGTNPYGPYNPNAVYPPYDISKCRNMLGRALAAKFDLAQSGQDYSDLSVQKAVLLTGLTKKQAEVTVKYCPKLMDFWYNEKLWSNKDNLTSDMLYRLLLNVDTGSTMVYADMIYDLSD